jgi:uncharacterized membrane protein YobD (UPF0266 family)
MNSRFTQLSKILTLNRNFLIANKNLSYSTIKSVHLNKKPSLLININHHRFLSTEINKKPLEDEPYQGTPQKKKQTTTVRLTIYYF